MDREGLDAELRGAKERGDVLLHSRKRGTEDPPAEVVETFERIVEFELPIKLLEEPHPEAPVAPDQRRNITRE